MALTKATQTINEGTSFKYVTTLLDDDEVTALALASIDSITLTLYDVVSGSIINSRTAQDVLNTNQVTIHATSGLLTWQGLAADAVIKNTLLVAGALEKHIALFEMVYSTDKALNHELILWVKQLTNVG